MAAPNPSASYSLTIRVEIPSVAGSFAKVAAAIGEADGDLGAIDLVRVTRESTRARRHGLGRRLRPRPADRRRRPRACPASRIVNVSDRTFLMHLGGKIEVQNKVPVKTRDDLSMAYTPGVARVCMAIAADPDKVRALTIKQNAVAVVTDGTAVLGLGDIGPRAAMPVMEGKAMLFKEFAGIDAWPHLPRHDRHRRDHRDREGDRAGLRRHQPRGHRRAPLLRDRGPAAPRARHPRLPRRPARHGRRRAGRPPERGQAGGRSGSTSCASCWSASGAAGVAVSKLLMEAGVQRHHRLRPRGRAAPRQEGADGDQEVVRAEHEPARVRRAPPTRRCAGADVFLGPVGPGRGLGRGGALDGRRRDRVRDGEPRPRGAAGGRSMGDVRVHRDRPLRLPEPDQQRARVPGHLPRRARRRRRPASTSR